MLKRRGKFPLPNFNFAGSGDTDGKDWYYIHQENSSGSARKATVTLKREKGGSAVLAITQLP